MEQTTAQNLKSDEFYFMNNAVDFDVSENTEKERSAGEKSSHAFRTISEVSTEIDVPQHVLRFWESKFTQIKPLKRGGGRRYYRPDDIELLRRIKNLLYKQGYTIKGVQRLLKETRGMARMETATRAKTQPFLPYASPQPHAPVSVLPESLLGLKAVGRLGYLQSLSAAPSSLAMAYGAVSNAIVEEGKAAQNLLHKTERLADAFEEITGKDIAQTESVETENTEDGGAHAQLSQSLEAVTEIHEQLSNPQTPIRVDANPAAIEVGEPLQTEPAEIMQSVEVEAVEVAPMPFAEEDDFNQDTDKLIEENKATKMELKSILEELVALRDMLESAAHA